MEEGAWHPVRVTKEGVCISHLFFADDVLLFCQASREQVQVVTETLNVFCEASGIRVNLEKYRMFCSMNVDQGRQQVLSTISGMRPASNLGKYLGIPLLKGRVTKTQFAPIIEKVNSRLASWKGKLLNNAGWLYLARSVLSSLPLYTMQALWLPKSVCNHVDKMVRRCVWAERDNTRSWNLVA